MYKVYPYSYQDSMCQRPMEGSIPDGTYKLTEEQAPIGYAKSGEVWSITIYNGARIST